VPLSLAAIIAKNYCQEKYAESIGKIARYGSEQTIDVGSTASQPCAKKPAARSELISSGRNEPCGNRHTIGRMIGRSTKYAAVWTDRRSTVSTCSHSTIAAWRTNVAITCSVFNLAEWRHESGGFNYFE
jgi:hypothetical protein